MWDKVSGILVTNERTGACEFELTFFVALRFSSLYHYLVGHPRVLPASKKQIHYFKVQYFFRISCFCCSIPLWSNHLLFVVFVQYFANYPSKFHRIRLGQNQSPEHLVPVPLTLTHSLALVNSELVFATFSNDAKLFSLWSSNVRRS